MEIIGYFAAALIGLSLGLIGGGGSILTVPVLVYLFHIDAVLATSYSLFIVGLSSLVGAYKNYRRGAIHIKTALLFGLTSITTVLLVRRLVVPIIPHHIATVGTFEVTQQMLTMVLFAILMVLASVSMIRSGRKKTAPMQEPAAQAPVLKLALYGIGIGLVTGFLGAGGGFLIIPALVLLLRLDMKIAIGTSLLIIAMNSLMGFLGDIGQFQIDWTFLLIIVAIAVSGIFAGTFLGQKIPGAKLKQGFGWFVLVMGCYIIIRELLIH